MKRELSEIIRDTVEETLNKLLGAEADELYDAGRYVRSPDRCHPSRIMTRVVSLLTPLHP
jgi:transposase-like protein